MEDLNQSGTEQYTEQYPEQYPEGREHYPEGREEHYPSLNQSEREYYPEGREELEDKHQFGREDHSSGEHYPSLNQSEREFFPSLDVMSESGREKNQLEREYPEGREALEDKNQLGREDHSPLENQGEQGRENYHPLENQGEQGIENYPYLEDLIDEANRAYEFRGRHKDSFTLYKLAEQITQENSHVNFRLGVMYYFGWNTDKDSETGLNYLKKAHSKIVDSSDPELQCDLGYMYECGLIVERDASMASMHYQIAADKGSARAQFNIAHQYHYGQGVPTNIEKAVKYYGLSANQGYAKAQYMLGHMYQNGIGLEQDLTKALQYYKLSSDMGSPRGHYIVGRMYLLGEGVEVDLAVTTKYYRMALDQGLAKGGYDLAFIYEGLNDYKTAIQCHLEASTQKEGKESTDYLLQMFRGYLGPEKRGEAVYYLAEDWKSPKIHKYLHPLCQDAMLEFICVFKNKDSVLLPELVVLIIRFLILVWPGNHFEHTCSDLENVG